MKKIIVALVFLAASAAGVSAQERRGGGERLTPEKRAEMQTKRMSEELGLNEDQQKKLLALHVERNKKAYEAGKEGVEKRREINEAYTKELNTILTPEQQEKLKEARKEGRNGREGMRRGGKQGKKPAGPQN